MDQIADLSFKADSKRLGDDPLHQFFGEFRHFIVEKYAYNMANSKDGGREVADVSETSVLIHYQSSADRLTLVPSKVAPLHVQRNHT